MEKTEGKTKKSFWHSLRYSTLVVEEVDGVCTKTVERKRSLAPIFIVLFLLVLVGCFFIVGFPERLYLNNLGEEFVSLFTPSKWSLKTIEGWWKYLFEVGCVKIFDTIEMTFIGTVFGAIIAVPFYILASSNIVKNKVVNSIIKVIINIIRTIPTFVLAVLGAIFYGYNEVAGIFALSVFSFGMVFKSMYEYVETCEMNSFEASNSSGATTLQGYINSVHPQVWPMYLSTFIYTFETNIRASVVLGFVGAGGIGQLISDAIESRNYDKVGAILVPLFIVVLVLDLVSTYLRKRLSTNGK